MTHEVNNPVVVRPPVTHTYTLTDDEAKMLGHFWCFIGDGNSTGTCDFKDKKTEVLALAMQFRKARS